MDKPAHTLVTLATALLAASVSGFGDIPREVTVGDRLYNVSVVLANVTDPKYNIVVDKMENIFFANTENKLICLKAGAADPVTVEGLPDRVTYVVMDLSGTIWIATGGGIYTYDYGSSSGKFALAKDHQIEFLEVGPDNTLYAKRHSDLYKRAEDNTLVKLDSEVLRALYGTDSMAVSSEGVFYFVRYEGVAVLDGGIAGDVKYIEDLPKQSVEHVLVDRRNNYVYILQSRELLLVKPGELHAHSALQAEHGHIAGMGFDSHGNIYLGQNDQYLVKMTPLSTK